MIGWRLIAEQLNYERTRLEEAEKDIANAKGILSLVEKNNVSPVDKQLRISGVLEYLGDTETRRISLHLRYVSLQKELNSLKRVKGNQETRCETES